MRGTLWRTNIEKLDKGKAGMNQPNLYSGLGNVKVQKGGGRGRGKSVLNLEKRDN